MVKDTRLDICFASSMPREQNHESEPGFFAGNAGPAMHKSRRDDWMGGSVSG